MLPHALLIRLVFWRIDMETCAASIGDVREWSADHAGLAANVKKYLREDFDNYDSVTLEIFDPNVDEESYESIGRGTDHSVSFMVCKGTTKRPEFYVEMQRYMVGVGNLMDWLWKGSVFNINWASLKEEQHAQAREEAVAAVPYLAVPQAVGA